MRFDPDAPLILLHGFTGHPSCWEAVIAGLPGRAAHAYALAGHEGAPDPAHPGTFEGEADRVAALVRRDCGARRAVLCGYSLGGRVALVLRDRHPDLFQGLVLIGASTGLRTAEERAERERADAHWVELAEREGTAAFVEAWEAQPLFASQRQLPEETRRAQRQRRQHHDPRGLAFSLRVLGLAAMPDMEPALGAIAIPVELVVGELDGKFRGVAERMQPRIPDARLHLVPGAGHNVVLERPAAVCAVLSGI